MHLEGCTKCRQALEETRLAWRIYDQHIPSEALVALAWGETPEGLDPGVLERHLETCPAVRGRAGDGPDKPQAGGGRPDRPFPYVC